MVSFSPLTGGGKTVVAGTAFDLSVVGYTAAEYACTGSARSYASAETADFATRVLVHRPVDAAAFNGTVWVEWLNVSGGLDAAPEWNFTHTELTRRGAAWVGVSAQALGVNGGSSLLGMAGPGLVGTDPARYGALHHPGDRFSYDIYAQVSAAARSSLLSGLDVQRVLGMGESQSAFRLTTFVNEVDPVVRVHDGFLVHARGGAAAPLDDDADPNQALTGSPVLFREDLRVPVLCVEAETDLINLGYLPARQPDNDALIVWEVAGASHADLYTFTIGAMDTGALPHERLAAAWAPVREIFGMVFDKPVNAGPQHYVLNAAVHQLERWVRDGTRPPTASRLETRDGGFVTDDVGNVRGGVRTPHVDAPVAVLSGLGNGGNPLSFLSGSTVPLSTEVLAKLYASRDDYVAQFTAATSAAVAAGFVLEDDGPEMIGIATRNAPS
jgi:alpha/beta hydrolase family protein